VQVQIPTQNLEGAIVFSWYRMWWLIWSPAIVTPTPLSWKSLAYRLATKKCHAGPHDTSWLPVCQRETFKTVALVWQLPETRWATTF